MLAFVLWILAAGPAPVITNPDWAALPSGEDLQAFYPPDALVKELEGKATIECTVTTAGTLTSCAVISEYPAGAGFGAATVQAATKFRMKPKTVDGKPVGTGLVRIPLNWTLSQAPDPEQIQAALAQAEACVGYAQARVPGLRGAGKRDIELYESWLAYYVYAAANSGLRPSEFTREIETRRSEAAAKLAAGEAAPAVCDAGPTGVWRVETN